MKISLRCKRYCKNIVSKKSTKTEATTVIHERESHCLISFTISRGKSECKIVHVRHRHSEVNRVKIELARLRTIHRPSLFSRKKDEHDSRDLMRRLQYKIVATEGGTGVVAAGAEEEEERRPEE